MALDGSSSYVAPANLREPADSLPIFDVQRVQLQFPIAADFVAAQVANNVLVLALSTNRVLRIDLDTPEDIDGKTYPSHFSQCLPDQTELTCVLSQQISTFPRSLQRSD